MEGVLKIRTFVAALGAASVALGLGACSTPETTSEEVTSLTLWNNSADSPAVLNLYEAFTEKTGIEIELVPVPADAFESTILTKWATGDRPDILEYHATTSLLLPLNPSETLQELSDLPYVEKSGDLYDSNGSVDGKVYAAVTGFPSVFGLYYNKAALEAAGVQPPTSFAELQSACTALKGSGTVPIYESGGSLWPTQILTLMYVADHNERDEYGQLIATNEGQLTDPSGPFLQGLQTYKSLQEDGCFNDDYATGTFEKAVASVVSGEVAMAAFQSDFYTQFLQAAGGDADTLADTVGWVPVSSTSPTGTYAPNPIGTFYAPKTGNEATEKAALEFISFATGEGYQQLLDDSRQLPVIDGYEPPADLNSLEQAYADAFETSTLAFNSNIAGFGAQFDDEMGKLINGQVTPEQAAVNLQSATEQASKAAGLPGW